MLTALRLGGMLRHLFGVISIFFVYASQRAVLLDGNFVRLTAAIFLTIGEAHVVLVLQACIATTLVQKFRRPTAAILLPLGGFATVLFGGDGPIFTVDLGCQPLLDVLAGLDAVENGHVDVEDDRSVVRFVLLSNFLNCLKAVLSRVDFFEVGLEDFLERNEHEVVVVCQQDARLLFCLNEASCALCVLKDRVE